MKTDFAPAKRVWFDIRHKARVEVPTDFAIEVCNCIFNQANRVIQSIRDEMFGIGE
jgi:hypothetical protein